MKRKILASDLNREVMRLREQCASANKALREVEKQCNSLSRLLEYAVWEEDMYRCDPIVFTGPTRKFVELLTPMLLSNRFKTAGKNNREAFLKYVPTLPVSPSNSAPFLMQSNGICRKKNEICRR